MMSYSILVPIPTRETVLLIKATNPMVPDNNTIRAIDAPKPPCVRSTEVSLSTVPSGRHWVNLQSLSKTVIVTNPAIQI